jgi:hypothetical protein
MMGTYNEIIYSMPVLDDAALELVDVEVEVDFVEAEVTSVVDELTEFVEDEVLVELGLDVSALGTHWPKAVSKEMLKVRGVIL